MHHGSRIKFLDVVRFFEDNYGFLMDRRGLQKRSKLMESKRSPKELDCNGLILRLMELRNIGAGSRSYLMRRNDSALQSMCWGIVRIEA